MFAVEPLRRYPGGARLPVEEILAALPIYLLAAWVGCSAGWVHLRTRGRRGLLPYFQAVLAALVTYGCGYLVVRGLFPR